jgi:hypothetical protein
MTVDSTFPAPDERIAQFAPIRKFTIAWLASMVPDRASWTQSIAQLDSTVPVPVALLIVRPSLALLMVTVNVLLLVGGEFGSSTTWMTKLVFPAAIDPTPEIAV